MRERYVHLTPRLAAALSMLDGADTVADIGCDHGRLTAALLQQNVCRRVIATDISAPSLQKAKTLLAHIGLNDRVSFRLGDGLDVIRPGECEVIAMLGMGGTLMTQILDRCSKEMNGASRLVLQPMRAQADIRKYLYARKYHIIDDRVVYEHGRFYQIFRAERNEQEQEIPQGFPDGFFDVGYQTYAQHDPNLSALCRFQLEQHKKQLSVAVGTEGESRLLSHIRALEQIIENLEN